jgi:ankyrin repeat protein
LKCGKRKPDADEHVWDEYKCANCGSQRYSRSEMNAKLRSAALNGDIGLVRKLLSNGADADVHEPAYEPTPLQLAAQKGHKEVAEFLISKGASIFVKTSGHRQALHFANHKDIAELLLAKGADVNEWALEGNEGMTPLHFAAQKGLEELVAFLLTKGADVNAHKCTYFDNICLSGYYEIHNAPLHVAVENGHSDVVELLLRNKADIDLGNRDGVTPLGVAAKNGNIGMMKLLLANGAKVNVVWKGGQYPHNGGSPLHYAAAGGCKEAVELLLANGANVNGRKWEEVGLLGATPLFDAAEAGNHEIVETLLAHGADVNISCKTHSFSGRITPLVITRWRKHHDVAELLCRHGGQEVGHW